MWSAIKRPVASHIFSTRGFCQGNFILRPCLSIVYPSTNPARCLWQRSKVPAGKGPWVIQTPSPHHEMHHDRELYQERIAINSGIRSFAEIHSHLSYFLFVLIHFNPITKKECITIETSLTNAFLYSFILYT